MSETYFGDDENSDEKTSKRIINGKRVKIQDYPYFVLIDSDECYCGGALLAENVVLTAAHCIIKSPLYNIKVIPGLNRRTQVKRTVYHPKKIIVHPRYKQNKTYDIALVILGSNIKLCSCIDLIDISSCSPEVGDEVTVVGYGYTKCERKKNGECMSTPSKYLRASDRRIISYEGPIMNTYSKETRTCLGDSGSPVVCNGELVGIHVGGEWFCGRTSYHISLAHPKIHSFLLENFVCMNT